MPSAEHDSTTPSLDDVAAQLQDLNARLRAAGDEPMAQAVAAAAIAMVPGARWCSITVQEKDRFRSLVASDELAKRVDQIQYEARTGPCLEAITSERIIVVKDLREETRWPGYSGPTAELGVRSIYSHPLHLLDDERSTAGLNLYSDEVGAFDASSHPMTTVLATYAALGISTVITRDRSEQLEKALRTNRGIAMAMGVLMSAHDVDSEDAFSLLRIASQSTNRRISDIAEEVIETRRLPLERRRG
ncbi:GAF and ANTAR domain-containing protein [Tessaracoccus rhinocerotis]|uniref:GAF and ANTAR domain-containing protein n=1 Tax=Tessaracoccus rhinocerotis TaxID=1689449 RepID=A0A553K0Y1_9ACTN|nr:GAF and ANTAR domain-containing protein [Tessaracoccus rhinocerotis]TRY18345.1 GAF and ANTAR domain-containing protein [Tessaracoccus rhinocerotis]